MADMEEKKDKDKKEDKEKSEKNDKDKKDSKEDKKDIDKKDSKEDKDKGKKDKKSKNLELKYEKKIKKIKNELEEQKDKYIYLQAELQNTRKHYIKEKEVARKLGKIGVINSFVPLSESFEKANVIKDKICSNLENENEENLKVNIKHFMEGYDKIVSQMEGIFKGLKITPIDEANIPFDYEFHEVMMRLENDLVPKNTVMQILQKGYKMGDEVIRPAKVIVSSIPKPPKVEEPQVDEEIIEEEDKPFPSTEEENDEPFPPACDGESNPDAEAQEQ